MATRRILDAAGVMLLFASLGLLVVTCLSTPDTSLPIFTLEAGRRFNARYSPQIRVQFGLWGYCQATSTAWRTHPQRCVRNHAHGYYPGSPVRSIIENFPSSTSTNQLRDLTLGFVLPAVATATTGLAIMAIAPAFYKRYRLASFASMVFSALSFIFALSAVGCVFAVFEKIRRETPSTSYIWTAAPASATRTRNLYVLSAKYGLCAWALVAACVVLLITTIVLSLAWRAAEREIRRNRSDSGVEKNRFSYSEGRASR